MNTQTPKAPRKRRGDDVEYWGGVLQAFSSLHEDVRSGARRISVDISPVIEAMIVGDHPFCHRRERGVAPLPADGPGVLPAWMVISTVVERVLRPGEVVDPHGHDAVPRMLAHRAKCLGHVLDDYRHGIDVLETFKLLGEPVVPPSCVQLLPEDAAAGCHCGFHQSPLAMKAFRAKVRLLDILPMVVTELGNSLESGI
jgi:hypothetical protein